MKENLKSMVTYLDHFLMWWECAMRIFVCSLVEYDALVEYKLDNVATGRIFVCFLFSHSFSSGGIDNTWPPIMETIYFCVRTLVATYFGIIYHSRIYIWS